FTAPPLIFSTPHRPPPHDIYSLSLHDALPISFRVHGSQSNMLQHIRSFPVTIVAREALVSHLHQISNRVRARCRDDLPLRSVLRSEEHTSELQSRFDLVCRLLLEKKKRTTYMT